MPARLLGSLQPCQAVPELGPLRLVPAIVPLEDWDDVMVLGVENIAQAHTVRFHDWASTSFSASFTRISPESSLGRRASRRAPSVRDSSKLTNIFPNSSRT